MGQIEIESHSFLEYWQNCLIHMQRTMQQVRQVFYWLMDGERTQAFLSYSVQVVFIEKKSI